jgi:outer membrane protein assembly factor BamB
MRAWPPADLRTGRWALVESVLAEVCALDARSGRRLWGQKLEQAIGGGVITYTADRKNAPEVPISGGGSWTSYALDPATGHLYVRTGRQPRARQCKGFTRRVFGTK